VRVSSRPPGVPSHQPPVDKTLILNNLKPGGKGTSYDASGKAKAVAQLTSAAEAQFRNWSGQNPRPSRETKDDYHLRRQEALRSSSPDSAPHRGVSRWNPRRARGRRTTGSRRRGTGARTPAAGANKPPCGQKLGRGGLQPVAVHLAALFFDGCMAQVG
jgi:hypothetical protein